MKDHAMATPIHPDVHKTGLRCSVIVPVFNHWDLVPELIACLNRQSAGLERFELLLVDNGSDRIPADMPMPAFARLLHCATPGSYSARNEAIRHARGEVLAFTDADCRPAPQWLEQGLACCRDAGGADAIVAGEIQMEAADSRMTPYEMYDIAMGLPQARFVREGFGATANLFIPRTVVQRVGTFEAGRLTGGDTEFCQRAGQHGVQVRYCERAIVRHPARRTWPELAVKTRRLMGGRIRSGPYRQRLYNVLHTLIPPVRRCGHILLSKQLLLSQRFIACAVQFRLWLVELLEVARMLLGLAAERR
jgi:glycosyltransferase involved in cell wall biosynthesis